MRWCVFCGSTRGDDASFVTATRELGRELALREIELVYGGGSIGLMGELADAVLANGGRAIGIIPQALNEREIGHSGLTKLLIVETMHERKAMMARLSDGFIALPGGYGTLEEFCEMVTWVQLALHDKPCLLLNVDGYFDPLIAMFDRARDRGFLSQRNREIVRSYQSVATLVAHLDDERARVRAASALS